MNTNCERCFREMRWDIVGPRVCLPCRMAACGLDPEQIEKTTGIPRERWVQADPIEGRLVPLRRA